MGCNSSKHVRSRIKEQVPTQNVRLLICQQAKIDELINKNQELEERLKKMQEDKAIEPQADNKVVEIYPVIRLIMQQDDLTGLKSTVDHRFTKLEKTMEKIHEDLKAKIFEGLAKNAGNVNEQQQQHQNGSLTLDFDQEYKKLMLAKNSMQIMINMPWKDVSTLL